MLMLALSGLFLPFNTNADDWPMLQYNSNHSGYNSISTAPTTNKTLWRSSGGGLSSVVVAADKVFVPTSGLYVLNKHNGLTLWKQYFTFEVSTPAVSNDIVFLCSYDDDTDKQTLYAFDIANGSLVWKYALDSTSTTTGSAPVVANGKVFVSAGGGTPHGDRLYTLSEDTGKLLWTFDTNRGKIRSSPAVADGFVFVASDWYGTHEKIYALDEDTGAEIWVTLGKSTYPRPPAVVNGKVFIGTTGYVYALNEYTGAEIWCYNIGHYVVSAPAVAYGKVFVGAGTYEHQPGVIVALNENTGEVIWNRTTAGRVDSYPVVADGKVFIGCLGAIFDEGYLYALNTTNGNAVWTYKFEIGVETTPAIADGLLFIQVDGTYAFGDLDSDNDGYPDDEDAFPNDPAASVDTDDDGYPDEWNPGKSEKDSTTGLKLDDYPYDSTKWKKEEKKKGFIPGFELISLISALSLALAFKRKVKI